MIPSLNAIDNSDKKGEEVETTLYEDDEEGDFRASEDDELDDEEGEMEDFEDGEGEEDIEGDFEDEEDEEEEDEELPKKKK